MRKWECYTAAEIQPRGWLRRQLEIQAQGLSGHLDKVWPDVRDSAWIGGEREGWERVPYWLDGFVPLAYLLEDADKIARARRYIDAILQRQQPDGWICPCREDERATYDTWAVQLIAKILVVYYECSGDARIPDAVYRILRNYYELLMDGTISLSSWAKARWFEAMIAIDFTYRRTPEDWLRQLAALLRRQGTDYTTLTERWKRPINRWAYETHIVNLAMMLKYEAVSCDLLGEAYTDKAEELYGILKAYNGTPVELFTGDECLSGLSPIQGSELCSVVELMYSYEQLYAYTGDRKWAERLEVIAFNALPATISEDMWTHQYLQMSNQIACEAFPGKSLFRTNGSEAHLFGLEPHFGCCTANFNQGWPKLALSAFLHSGDTVISALPIPSRLSTEAVTVTLETAYPFVNRLHYTIEARKATTFTVRVPSFAKKLTVNGKARPTADVSVTLSAGEVRELVLDFETVPVLEARPHGLHCMRCGSLVFSLPIAYEKRMREYEKNGVERKFPYCDYELIPTENWAYGFADGTLRVQRAPLTDVPFCETAPPITVKALVAPIDWGLEDGYETVCAKVPHSTAPLGSAREVTFYPYGCAKLRMTELPMAK